MDDRELLDLIPLLENLSKVDSVYAVLKNKEQVQQQIQSASALTNSSPKRSSTTGTTTAAAVT